MELTPDPDLPAWHDSPEVPDARAQARDLPDPDERARAYDAARTNAMLSERYQSELPRFQHMWAEHEDRWPARDAPQAVVKPREDLAAAIGRIRDSEPTISADLKAAERDTTCSAWLAGFDHRLKSDIRLVEKAASAGIDATPAEALGQVSDAIRYTFCVDPDRYTHAYHEIRARLEHCGYEMYQCKNFWADPEYKGVNTRWLTAEGVRFEVQFHTPDSFHAKHEVTHASYERLRNPGTTDIERGDLETFQQDVSSRLDVPDGATEILAFRKKGQ